MYIHVHMCIHTYINNSNTRNDNNNDDSNNNDTNNDMYIGN